MYYLTPKASFRTLSEHLDVNILLKSSNIMTAAATMDIYNYENSKRPTSRFSDGIASKYFYRKKL